MAEKYSTLAALFTDIADAIREKTGATATIVADDFPDVIRNVLQVKSYLTFSSPSSFTLAVNDATKHWDGTLEYSTNTSAWSTWDGTTTLSSATSGSDNVLYLRGTGNTVITGNNNSYKWVLTGSDIACTGNIENLLDYETVKSGGHPIMAKYCYAYMFYDCSSIKLSTAQTGEYTIAYRIPMSGTGTTVKRALTNMFTGTGGTFTETPEINKTYYLSNTNTIV